VIGAVEIRIAGCWTREGKGGKAGSRYFAREGRKLRSKSTLVCWEWEGPRPLLEAHARADKSGLLLSRSIVHFICLCVYYQAFENPVTAMEGCTLGCSLFSESRQTL
jgi:hypothetical protein